MKKILLFILFMILVIGGTDNVLAANRVNGYSMGSIFHARKNDGYFSKYGQLLDFQAIEGDYVGKHVYCLAPSEELNPTVDYKVNSYKYYDILNEINNTQKDSSNRITKEQLDRIKLISFYGYDYPGRQSNEYKIAAQMLIYQTIENQVFTNVLCSNRDCQEIENPYIDEMQEINNDVDQHFVRPSFNGSYVYFKLNGPTQFEDKNGVLSKYEVDRCDNCTAKIEGNILTITPKSKGYINMYLVKGKDLYDKNLAFLTSSDSQNMVVPGNIDPIYAGVSGTVVSGSIEIKKEGENKQGLENASFNVYSDSDDLVCTITTNSEGTGKCTDLELGKYYLVENSAPLGYVLDSTKYYFEITQNELDIEKTIINQKIKGDVELFKEDSEVKVAQGDATLKGAIYGIYKSDGTKIAEVTTDDKGYFKYENLDYGDYYIQEITPSLGYLLDPNRYDFQIRENLEVIKVVSKEQVQKFDFNLLKTMSQGASGVIEVEDGAVFQIFDNDTLEYIGDITTDSNGKAKIILPYGTYKVCQKSGNKKTFLADCFVITLHEDIDKVVNNEYVKAKLKVVKIDEETKEVIPLKGIKFKIKNLDTNKYVCQSVSYPGIKTYCVFETNKDGILITPDYLFAGRYQLEEVDQKINGYLWNENPFVFEINADANIIEVEDIGKVLEVQFANQEVLGEIIVKKVGEIVNYDDGLVYDEKVLQGIQFLLYDENMMLIGSYETDEDGYIKISNLKLGKYFLKESSTSAGYVLDDTLYEIDLDYIDQYTKVVTKEINIKNNLQKGTLIIKKKSDIDIPLEGIKFKLYDAENNLIGIYVTDDKGQINVDLPYGKYYLEEVVTRVGYKLDEEIKEIIIDDKEITLDLINERLMTKVNLLKVNTDGEPLEGVKFNLFDLDGNLIGTYITDKDGYIRVSVPYGSYYFQEVETVEGYFLEDKKLEFEVDSLDEINLVYENYRKIRVPSTGSNDNTFKLNFLLGIGWLLLISCKKRTLFN